jgi:hypothetical protein
LDELPKSPTVTSSFAEFSRDMNRAVVKELRRASVAELNPARMVVRTVWSQLLSWKLAPPMPTKAIQVMHFLHVLPFFIASLLRCGPSTRRALVSQFTVELIDG